MTPAVSAPAPSDLTAALWRTYQQGRGTAEAVVHVDYLLTLFLLKCLDQGLRPLPGLVLPEAAQFATLIARRLEPQLGARLDAALAALAKANPEVFSHVFDHIVFARPPHLSVAAARDHYLRQLLDLVDALPLDWSAQGASQQPGRAASALLARVAREAGKKGSAWCTPPDVAELLARLLDPQVGERLSDPHCGSGALLGALAEQVGQPLVTLSGQEGDGAAYGRCRLRLLLHGLAYPQLELGDAIRSPRLLAGDALQQFDVVATQLPLSTGAWGHERAAQDPYQRFWRGVPPATQGDFAYISHVLATLKGPTGRAGLLVAHGALFRTGQDGRIRQQLLEENLLDAVIGLPAQLIPGVNSPVAILLFRKGRTRQEVLFLEASTATTPEPLTNLLSDECLTHLVQTYRAYETVLPHARCVPLAELRQNDYNLNLARYVRAPAPEPAGTLQGTQAEIRRLEGELLGIQAEILTCLRALGIEENN